MLSLSYSASYDPYNTIFRMLAVLKRSEMQAMNIEVLSIADFFVCFPNRLSEIRPPNSVKGMRKRTNAVIKEAAATEYELLPASKILFERMDIIQETALSAMQANNLVNIEKHGANRVAKLSRLAIPETLVKNIDTFIQRNAALIDLVAQDFPAIQIAGPDGLKARTGLGEYMYDTL